MASQGCIELGHQNYRVTYIQGRTRTDGLGRTDANVRGRTYADGRMRTDRRGWMDTDGRMRTDGRGRRWTIRRSIGADSGVINVIRGAVCLKTKCATDKLGRATCDLIKIVTLRGAKRGSAGVPVAKCGVAGDRQHSQEMRC